MLELALECKRWLVKQQEYSNILFLLYRMQNMSMEFFYPAKCYISQKTYCPDLEKNNRIFVADLLFKVMYILMF